MLVPYNLAALPELGSASGVPEASQLILGREALGAVVRDLTEAEAQQALAHTAERYPDIHRGPVEDIKVVPRARGVLSALRLTGQLVYAAHTGLGFNAIIVDNPLHLDPEVAGQDELVFHYTKVGRSTAHFFDVVGDRYREYFSSRSGNIKNKKTFKQGLVDDDFLNPNGYTTNMGPGTLLIFRATGVAHGFVSKGMRRKAQITALSWDKAEEKARQH